MLELLSQCKLLSQAELCRATAVWLTAKLWQMLSTIKPAVSAGACIGIGITLAYGTDAKLENKM